MKALLLVVVLAFGAVFLRASATLAATGQLGPIGQGVAQWYAADTQVGAFRSGMGASETMDVARLTSTTAANGLYPNEFQLGKAAIGCRATVSVWVHFTVAAQTCQVALLYIDRDASGAVTAIPGPSVTLTSTSGTGTDAAGKFMAPQIVFDGAAATGFIPVLTTAPTSGKCDFYVGSE